MRALGSRYLLVPVMMFGALAACSSASSGGGHPGGSSTLAMTGGHATVGEIVISRAYIPDPATPSIAVAYFTVTNAGPADRLVSVHTSGFRSAMLHRYVTTSDGAASMVPVPQGVVIPAHGKLTLHPGAFHVMLQRPARPLRQGMTERLTLRFARAGTVTVKVPVVADTGLPAADSMPGMNMSGTSMPGMNMSGSGG